jgi:alpha-tubulin suppressor-like RCC1 family protein
MSDKTMIFFKKFKVLNKVVFENFDKIKLLYVFSKNNVFLVTNDDKIFAFGDNKGRVLGFGHKNSISELTINKELSHKQIIDFKNGSCYVIARTIDGKVYCWGNNQSFAREGCREGVAPSGKNLKGGT